MKRIRTALRHFLDSRRHPAAYRASFVAGLVAIGAVSAGVTTALSSASVAAPSLVPTGVDLVQSTPTTLAVAFRILREAAADGAAPAFMAREASEFNANPSLGRRAFVTSAGDSFYLVPGQDSICALDEALTVDQCTSAVVAETIGNVQATTCSPYLDSTDVEVSGILPRSAIAATVNLTDGTTQRVTIQNGVFVLLTPRSSPLPVSVTWVSMLGVKHTLTANMPTDAGSEKCGNASGITPAIAAEFARVHQFGAPANGAS